MGPNISQHKHKRTTMKKSHFIQAFVLCKDARTKLNTLFHYVFMKHFTHPKFSFGMYYTPDIHNLICYPKKSFKKQVIVLYLFLDNKAKFYF